MEANRSIRGVNGELTHPGNPALERVVDSAIARRERTLGGLAGSLIRRLGQWRQAQRTMSALSRLDDRILADIGLQRADLHALVETTLRRR